MATFEEFFNQLLDESPMIQGLMYPSLAEIAQQQACRFDTLDMLNLIIRQVLAAPDVDAARRLLESGPEM